MRPVFRAHDRNDRIDSRYRFCVRGPRPRSFKRRRNSSTRVASTSASTRKRNRPTPSSVVLDTRESLAAPDHNLYTYRHWLGVSWFVDAGHRSPFALTVGCVPKLSHRHHEHPSIACTPRARKSKLPRVLTGAFLRLPFLTARTTFGQPSVDFRNSPPDGAADPHGPWKLSRAIKPADGTYREAKHVGKFLCADRDLSVLKTRVFVANRTHDNHTTPASSILSP